MTAVPDSLTLETLREMLGAIDPAALLVEPRILRRVIRLDRRLAGLGLFVPHRKSYTIERDRLLAFVDRAELELPPGAESAAGGDSDFPADGRRGVGVGLGGTSAAALPAAVISFACASGVGAADGGATAVARICRPATAADW